jgi:DNA-binding MarR family transcriptional regulator
MDAAPTPDRRVAPVPAREDIVRLLCAYASESLRSTEMWAAARGINHTDIRAMAELGQAQQAGGVMTAGDLGRALGLSSPATSALIARLERGGHVTRSRDPEDRRRVLLTASASAQQGAVAYFKPMGDAVTAALVGCSEQELGVVAGFLERLVMHMRAIPPL